MHAVAAKFDLVAVRSPGVDRRALSQAWYDALHIVGSSGTPRSSASLRRARLFPRGKVCSPTFSSRHPWLPKKLERPAGSAPRVPFPTAEEKVYGERRGRLLPLASDILARLRAQPKAVRFVFEMPEGRVCLYVVRGERRMQMAAFCPPVLRDVVERALAQVRYAL